MNAAKNIVIFGASDQAKVAIDIIEKGGKFNIIGVIDDSENKSALLLGYKTLGITGDLPKLIREYAIYGGIVAIGDNWTRSKVAKSIKKLVPRFQFISAVHPSAQIGIDVLIGKGSIITAGSIINVSSRIGRHCIVNTKASIDHDCKISDFASIGPGATLAGHVNLGGYSAICVGANIINNITIGKHAIIGSGATVIKNIPNYVVAYGTPAKVIRKRNAEDNYL